VAPGWIPVERHRDVDPKLREDYRLKVALGHMGLPNDVAAMVTFLASPEASFITGQTFAVNGGRTLA
jgi:3-oxoacyl-[acyl-carrier protein] reductase